MILNPAPTHSRLYKDAPNLSAGPTLTLTLTLTVVRQEWIAKFGDDSGFDQLDGDGDGTVSLEEYMKQAE